MSKIAVCIYSCCRKEGMKHPDIRRLSVSVLALLRRDDVVNTPQPYLLQTRCFHGFDLPDVLEGQKSEWVVIGGATAFRQVLVR